MHWFRVNKPDRRTVGHTTGKASGRIYIETCANDHQYIGLHTEFCRYLYIGYLLTEPYNIRTQRTTIWSLIAILNFRILWRESYNLRRRVWSDATCNLHKFTVQVNNTCTSSTLVQVIYILSDYLHIIKSLQFGKKFVSQTWLCIQHLLTA